MGLGGVRCCVDGRVWWCFVRLVWGVKMYLSTFSSVLFLPSRIFYANRSWVSAGCCLVLVHYFRSAIRDSRDLMRGETLWPRSLDSYTVTVRSLYCSRIFLRIDEIQGRGCNAIDFRRCFSLRQIWSFDEMERPMPVANPNSNPQSLKEQLANYGCTDFIRLDEKLSTPAQLDYLDLLPKRSNQTPILTAVAEHQGTALLYLVDASGDSSIDANLLTALCRQLANRSDPAWLGVLRPGSLEIFPIGFHKTTANQPIETIEKGSLSAPFFFQSLAHGSFKENHKLHGTDYVYRKIFELLTRTTNEFVPQKGKGVIDSLEVLSMAGRALFFRFLIDRRIVLESELSGPDGICPSAVDLKDVFSTAKKAAETSTWLDATFNGDFLPLIDESISTNDRIARKTAYLEFFNRTEKLVGKKIFTHLHAILCGWEAVGESIQAELDWGDLDFAHIPVGVLSQVYESFSHRADPRTARDTSVHYTPRTIAKLMVDEAFAAANRPSDAKVLDSSCGAGIFLVLAFRRLVREHWSGAERPKTADIQKILYNQIRGFDISESALRLAALSLYITAIELNASQRPPIALKFPKNLRGSVLHRFIDSGDINKVDAVFPLGSLGPEVPCEFDKSFDIVIGNPPWTRLRDDSERSKDKNYVSPTSAINAEFTKIGRRVLAARGLDGLAYEYENPDKNPDIPFLWRAMEWAKDEGIIALAMPARLFGRTSGKGFETWRAILRSVEITGLINGADLRKTSVWDGIDMPFCMFFARNRMPKTDHRFYYATPSFEPELNADGRFRIDYESAYPISTSRVEKQPWLLKTLSLGTWLDVEVMDSILSLPFETLADFWKKWDKSGDKSGQGYNLSPDRPQKSAEFLTRLLDFRPPHGEPTLQREQPPTFFERYKTRTASRPKTESLYQPPLVIVPQSPGDDSLSPKAYFSNESMAFSQSYYGYSCAGHPEAETLAALIYLLPHSKLFSYFCLMTSRRSGFDRQTFNKEEFDALPFPDIAKISPSKKSEILKLSRQFQENVDKPWDAMNAFIFSLYGLEEDAVQVANDTLFAAMSYRKAGREALHYTDQVTRCDFINALREALEPYFEVCGEHVVIRDPAYQVVDPSAPWFFLSISREPEVVNINSRLLRSAMEVANQRGCSRIIVHAPKKTGLLLGLLNRRKWWTITRARLCAQHIIRERLGAFGLPEEV